MGHYNQKTTLASLNLKMVFAKKKLREYEYENNELSKQNQLLQASIEMFQIEKQKNLEETEKHLQLMDELRLALQASIREKKQMHEALEFYADGKVYFPQDDDICSLITMDYGSKARHALSLVSEL
ncbi:hypothetical protein [Lysinibacillus sp. SGAir0095]|uniref:hypothetical protein n=1 Tax=Lysinibacillus sp. SGAir0095 TaxID=2070463 RepID=UPI0010CD18FD|nr:hypothetical protein [Lysinibacillus sp. SGAir0095]QCR33155.1 hypothetical protein C1N55_13620 [Lysinibacillus sp. SGAir0095]